MLKRDVGEVTISLQLYLSGLLPTPQAYNNYNIKSLIRGSDYIYTLYAYYFSP